MSTDGVRESRDGGGDLRYESQEVTTKAGSQWFVIWEKGETETHVGIRVGLTVPCDLEDCR